MGTIKQINIKNQTYYFHNDIINLENFDAGLLKIDKKSNKDINIYYIGYIKKKKIGDCNNINSTNPLYLIIHSATGYFKEKNSEKFLILDSIQKYEKVFSGIKSKIETINDRKELFYKKKYARIGVNTDDDIPLNKQL